MNPEIQKELQNLYEAGKLRASETVSRAKKKTSAMHDVFEWDDAKAGHEHRLDQARHLIKSVRIIVDGEECQTFHIPASSVEIEAGSREGRYEVPSVMVRQEGLYDRAMGQALSQLQGAHANVDALAKAKGGNAKNLAGAMEDITRAKRKLERETPSA